MSDMNSPDLPVKPLLVPALHLLDFALPVTNNVPCHLLNVRTMAFFLGLLRHNDGSL